MSSWAVSTAWGAERVGEEVVDLAGDAIALVQSGRPALLLAELLGVGQQRGGLLGLEAVAAFEAAEEQTQDEGERVEQHLPRGNAEHQSGRPDRKYPGTGNGAGHGQAEG